MVKNHSLKYYKQFCKITIMRILMHFDRYKGILCINLNFSNFFNHGFIFTSILLNLMKECQLTSG